MQNKSIYRSKQSRNDEAENIPLNEVEVASFPKPGRAPITATNEEYLDNN